MDEIKTKSFTSFLTAVKRGQARPSSSLPRSTTSSSRAPATSRASSPRPAKLINVYDLLNAKTLVIDKAALAVIEEVFA